MPLQRCFDDAAGTPPVGLESRYLNRTEVTMAEHANVVRVARFHPAQGGREEVVNRLQSGIDGIRQRDGCFGAQICTVREDPDVIVIVSRWVSQAALDQFLSDTVDQRAQAAALLSEPAKTETFVSI
jgi:quinol monooxygenase YgiN